MLINKQMAAEDEHDKQYYLAIEEQQNDAFQRE
jgi:hypothetical protein